MCSFHMLLEVTHQATPAGVFDLLPTVARIHIYSIYSIIVFEAVTASFAAPPPHDAARIALHYNVNL